MGRPGAGLEGGGEGAADGGGSRAGGAWEQEPRPRRTLGGNLEILTEECARL